MRYMRIWLVACVGLCLAPATALAATGDLTQKPGTAGCISNDGTGGTCVHGTALAGASGGAVSPDGRNVYVAGKPAQGGVAVFDRAASGALTQKPGTAGCISDTGTGGACAAGTALLGSRGTAVSPDGNSVYVTVSDPTGAIAIFDRAANGTLTQKPGTAGCISDTGTGGSCVDGKALARPDGFTAVTVSPDGHNVYVADENTSAVAVFDRAADGTLTQKAGTAGCVSETGLGGECADGKGLSGAWSVVVSSDGANAYVMGRGAGSVAAFDRAADGTLTQKAGTAGCISDNGSAGDCADGNALVTPLAMTISPDGKNIYVANNGGAVVVIDRAPDGTIAQKPGTAGCVSDNGTGGTCVDGTSLNGNRGVAVSPDGASVYVASGTSVDVFTRAADGTITQRPGLAACISETGAGPCTDGNALSSPDTLLVSPDGRSVYGAVESSSAVVVFDRELAAASSPPSATTGAATAITDTGAGLAGTLNPHGVDTNYTFEYGTSLSFGQITTPDDALDGTTDVPVTASLTGLAPNTTYLYRLVATSSAGTAFGTVRSFRTTGPAQAPAAITGAASGVGPTFADVAGQVNPNGRQTVFTFEYGTTTTFGQISQVVALDDASALEPVAAHLTGLQADTTYLYRVVAVNAAGTTVGVVRSFKTGPGGIPVATTGAASGVTATSALLGGTVGPNGATTAFTFEYGTTTSFGQVTAVDLTDDANTTQTVTLPATGLAPNTTYLYRIVATNQNGTTTGTVRSFTTPPGT